MKKLIFGLISILLSASFVCSADLMITPLRAAFVADKRSEEIILVNTSEEVKSYRLEWMEQAANANGGYRGLTEQESGSFPVASKFLRYSPRQVTLKPGESQTIKLVLRKPNNLPAGDYRSHLRFRAIPKVLSPEAGINVYAVMSFAIPVIVRQGAQQANISVNSLALGDINGKPQIKATIIRKGPSSVVGNFQVFYQPTGSQKEIEIAKYNDYSVYSEVSQTQVSLINTAEMPTQLNGTIRVDYKGTHEWSGTTFASAKYQVNGRGIRPLN